MKIPSVKVVPEYTAFRGGLDLVSPAIQIKPGALIACMNYMCETDGGYSRIDGYEAYDGQTSPSAATYYYCPCTFTAGGPATGDTVTGAVSSKTGVVIVVGAAYICITKRSGDFNATEVFNVGGIAKGTFTLAHSEAGETSGLLHATALNLAADQYRADIVAPSGTYAVRGLGLLAGILYAFVDNAGGTAGEIYKSSAAGWVAITLHSELSFDTGLAAGIAEGNTVTQLVTGATGVVERVVLESGSWAGNNAAGRLILSGGAGVFDATNALQVAATTRATSTSLKTAITISTGGRYEIVNYNFTGSTATNRLYGCDGVNRGFEFDGSIYVPIDTGMTTDTPVHVKAYKQQLFFSFLGSAQHSAPGTPYVWSAVLGASELGIGDNIVGFARQAEAMAIMSRNSTHQLTGNNVTTWVLDDVSDDSGAIPWTIQTSGKTFYLDDSGVIELSRVIEYGNFNINTISRSIQPRITAMQKVVVASSIYHAKNQYRLYGSDGSGISMTLGAGRYGPEYYYTIFQYPMNVSCAVSGEDSTGKDVVFLGDDAGNVYQADKGSSFNGAKIEAYVFLPFNNSKSPSVLKTYRKATMEMSANGYGAVQLGALLSYGSQEVEAHRTVDFTVAKGGLWDFANFEDIFYDSDVVANPSFALEGDGINISIIIYSNSEIDLGHKIDGAIIHFTPRRLVR